MNTASQNGRRSERVLKSNFVGPDLLHHCFVDLQTYLVWLVLPMLKNSVLTSLANFVEKLLQYSPTDRTSELEIHWCERTVGEPPQKSAALLNRGGENMLEAGLGVDLGVERNKQGGDASLRS